MNDAKLYYSIREVCETLGLKDSVLRHWESEIPKIRPKQGKLSKKRMYTQKDIDLIRRAKELIYDEGLSVLEAKKRIAEERSEARSAKKTVTIKTVASDVNSINDADTESVNTEDVDTAHIDNIDVRNVNTDNVDIGNVGIDNVNTDSVDTDKADTKIVQTELFVDNQAPSSMSIDKSLLADIRDDLVDILAILKS